MRKIEGSKGEVAIHEWAPVGEPTYVVLLAHGYAANVVVKDGEGKVSFSGPVIFLPQDGNFSSMGTIKAPDARPEQLGFEGYFLPTAVMASA